MFCFKNLMMFLIIINKHQCMCCDLFKSNFHFFVVCYLCVKYIFHLIEKKIIIFLYNFLVFILLGTKKIWFAWFYLVNFQLFGLLFSCASVTGHLWSICLGIFLFSILRCVWSQRHYLRDKTYLNYLNLQFAVTEIFLF